MPAAFKGALITPLMKKEVQNQKMGFKAKSLQQNAEGFSKSLSCE
jgi:hypothetical protein